MPPRNQHFVPRSWQNRFSPDNTVMVWSYDHDRQSLLLRSTKTTMFERDLYTVDPQGAVDTSLEEIEFAQIDDDGAQVLTRIIGGDRSEDSRKKLAAFLAVGLLRTPAIVDRYRELTKRLILQLLDATDTNDYAAFIASARHNFHAGFSMPEADFEDLKAIPPEGLELWIEDRLSRLDQPNGDPELPFTDAIRDPSGRKIIEAVLLSLDWAIAEAPNGGLILGDMGPVYDHQDLASGLRAPLSPSIALIARPATAGANPCTGMNSLTWEQYEVDGLNAESAARATRWIIASDRSHIEPLTNQLFRQSK